MFCVLQRYPYITCHITSYIKVRAIILWEPLILQKKTTEKVNFFTPRSMQVRPRRNHQKFAQNGSPAAQIAPQSNRHTHIPIGSHWEHPRKVADTIPKAPEDPAVYGRRSRMRLCLTLWGFDLFLSGYLFVSTTWEHNFFLKSVVFFHSI